MQSSPTLLLVDDNDLDVEVVLRLLRRLALDISVVRARNGEEALELLGGSAPTSDLRPPLVVLLDINMPRMNGFEFLEAMHRNDDLQRLPVFVLSTSSDPRDAGRAEEYGVYGYLVKPIDEERLMSALTAACPSDAAADDAAERAPNGDD